MITRALTTRPLTTRPLTTRPPIRALAHGVRLRLRALVGVVVLATSSVGCNAVTEASAADDLSGRYLLTHHNAAPVPVVTDQVPSMVEELQAGEVTLAASADSTFSLALVWRDTYRPSGRTEVSIEVYRGSFTKRGDTVRLTVTEEDGEAEELPWTVTGELRTGVLRASFGDELENAVLTFRKE